MDFLRLVSRNLSRHRLRSFLTVGSIVVAVFLLCTLRTLVTTLGNLTAAARSDRLSVQSAVSLFVDMPLSYQSKLIAVDGVKDVMKWQWFGGVYQDPSNFFGQFAVDEKKLIEIYPEFEIVEGSQEDFLGTRTACMVGRGLVDKFDWKVGQTIPLKGALFPHPGGPDTPWEFQLAAVYEPTKASFDDRTMFFHWEYFEETYEQTDAGSQGVGVGVFMLQTEPGANATKVMSDVDALFENGPQRVQTTTEAEFQAQFVSMFGNVPFFVSAIGGAVLFAILLSCVNTMLMAAREQTRDVGVLKSMGFSNGRMFALFMAQSVLLSGLGGALGLGLAFGAEGAIATMLGSMIAGYQITDETLVYAVLVTIAIGVVAGFVPAWRASRMPCVTALSARE